MNKMYRPGTNPILSPILPILAIAVSVTAGAATDSAVTTTDSRAPVVDSIAIDNRNIYDTESDRYSSFVFRWANRLHIKTRRHIIRRELLVHKGEPFSGLLAEETARNLRDRLVLYDAWLEKVELPDGRLLVRVVTVDQWSLSGGLGINHEAQRTKYHVSFAERNFLGNNQVVRCSYHFDDEDGDHIVGHFGEQRLFGRSLHLVAAYSGSQTDGYELVSLSRPFYDLSQRLSYRLSTARTDGQREVYDDNRLIAQSDYVGEWVEVGAALRVGPYTDKTTFDLEYRYRRESSGEYRIYADTTAARAALPADSVLHRVRLKVAFSEMDYVKLQRLNGFHYTEDIRVGAAAAACIGRAVNYAGKVYDELSLGLAYRMYLHSTLIALSAENTTWYGGGETHRRNTRVNLGCYNVQLEFFTLAMRARYEEDWRSGRTNPLVLGGLTGLRGYDEHSQTGDRVGLMNIEGRFFPDIEIMSVMFGGAIFADVGRAWKAGNPFRFRDFQTAVGAGLRISLEKSSKTAFLRCDLAHSDETGWQLSVSSRQYFEVPSVVSLLTTR